MTSRSLEQGFEGRSVSIAFGERVSSPRIAIRVACLDCAGEEVGAITGCGDRCCALWCFRAFQRYNATTRRTAP